MQTTVMTDVDNVILTIRETLSDLKKGIQPEKLSAADKVEILSELDKIKALALSIKRQISG